MSFSRDGLTVRQWKLIRRTEHRLKQGLERLQWEEDVLFPEVEALKANKSVMGLPPNAALEISVLSETLNPAKTDTDKTD